MGPIQGGVKALLDAEQRPRRRRGGVFSCLMLGLVATLLTAGAPGAALAQDTTAVKRDTLAPAIAPDTGGLKADTGGVKADTTAADTIPPPVLPAMPAPSRSGWGAGIWVWQRDDLLLTGAVTLADLLERIPGVTAIRTGWYGQPEAVTSFGETGGRVEVYLNGYELVPLNSGVPDLAELTLVGIESVRVERRMDVLRVDLTSASPSTPQSYARIEAGVGIPNTKTFRGIFLAPHFIFGPFAGGVEHLDTDGTHRSQPGNWLEGWVKWGMLRKNRGVLFELRRDHLQRAAGVPWVGNTDRTDWTIRARNRILPGLVAELYTGSSSLAEPPVVDTMQIADSTGVHVAYDTTAVDHTDRQSGARLAYAGAEGWARAEVRLHSSHLLPASDADLSAGVSPLPFVSVSGTVERADWRTRSATSSDVRGEIGPFRGLSAVAEFSSGTRGMPIASDTPGPSLFHRTAWRIGGELTWRGLKGGAAYVTINQDSVPGFGLTFDRGLGPSLSSKLSGWEGYAHVPLLRTPFYIEGSFMNWTNGPLWIYTPLTSYRVALAVHDEPLSSGHLEILARAEYRSRGQMFVPQDSVPVVQIPAVNALDFYLQIRILDLRAYIRYEDALHSKPVYDFPGTEIPGPRMVYGIKWQFFN